VDFIDSATVRVLAASKDTLDGQGRRLIVRSPSRVAARMLGLFGLGDLIEAPDGAGP
jgi:anti-anti-sigma regulatory factor